MFAKGASSSSSSKSVRYYLTPSILPGMKRAHLYNALSAQYLTCCRESVNGSRYHTNRRGDTECVYPPGWLGSRSRSGARWAGRFPHSNIELKPLPSSRSLALGGPTTVFTSIWNWSRSPQRLLCCLKNLRASSAKHVKGNGQSRAVSRRAGLFMNYPTS